MTALKDKYINPLTDSWWLQRQTWGSNKFKRNKIIVTFLLLLHGSFCFGQEDKTLSKQNSFQVGILLNQLKEENLHPKVHSGAGLAFYFLSIPTKRENQ